MVFTEYFDKQGYRKSNLYDLFTPFSIQREKTYNVNTSPSELKNACTLANWGGEFDIKYLFMPSVNFEETQ
jgi:hypothetical protein